MRVTEEPVAEPRSVPTGDMALRILAATAVCVAGQGLRATSIDDIAEAAGCARATIYRLFPGGRAGLLAAAAELQVTTVLQAAGVAADAEEHLAEAVTASVCAASTTLAGHVALQRLLAEEPGVVLPFISFDGLGPLLARAAEWGRRHLGRFLSDRGRGGGGVGRTGRARPPPCSRLAHRHHRPGRRAPHRRPVPGPRPGPDHLVGAVRLHSLMIPGAL